MPVPATPTDRVDPQRIHLLGVARTLAGPLGFALLAEGFRSALAFRGLAGIGWGLAFASIAIAMGLGRIAFQRLRRRDPAGARGSG